MRRSTLFAAAVILMSSTAIAKADAYCYVPDPFTAFLDRIFGNVCYPAPPPVAPVPVPIPGRQRMGPPPMVIPGPIYDCPVRPVPTPTGVMLMPYC